MYQNQQSPAYNEKPGQITAIGILILFSGLTDVGLFFAWLIGIITGGIATLGIGLLCLPLVIPPLALAVFEFIFGAKLFSEKPASAKAYKTMAILEIVSILFGNVVGLVTGILILVWLNDPRIAGWFNRNNPVVIN
jgi:hypothetical protein